MQVARDTKAVNMRTRQSTVTAESVDPGQTLDTILTVPTGPESCYLDLRVLGEPGSVLADAAPILRVLRDEDGFACEQMQAVVRSSSFAVGPLSIRHELPIHQFHSDVLSFLA